MRQQFSVQEKGRFGKVLTEKPSNKMVSINVVSPADKYRIFIMNRIVSTGSPVHLPVDYVDFLKNIYQLKVVLMLENCGS